MVRVGLGTLLRCYLSIPLYIVGKLIRKETVAELGRLAVARELLSGT